MLTCQIKKPYLLLLGDVENINNAKTAFGLRDWAPEACLGQLRFDDCAADLGLRDMSPLQAVQAGAKTLVIGIAPPGGQLPSSWHPVLRDSLSVGLDIASGLHQRLTDIPELVRCAQEFGRQLHDVRHQRAKPSIGTGRRRTGRRLLTVGTDCALGKKYTALAIAKAMASKGFAADFRATGQTGILISGCGIAVDAVAADFIAGAAEELSPENSKDHWDVVEGQGSLFHPAYAGVTLGLVHGTQPDALVLCHDPTRKVLSGFPHVPVVSLDQAISVYEAAARLTNPGARFVGVSLNTSAMNDAEAGEVMKQTSLWLRLPCVDPMRTGVDQIVARLESFT